MNNKKVAIDARMIEMSGIGMYIRYLVSAGIYNIALGRKDEIKKYADISEVIDYDVNLHDLFSEPMSRTFVFFKEGRSTDLDSEKMLVSMKDYKLTDVSFLLISDGVSEIYATPGFYD